MKDKPTEWIAISDLMAGVVGVVMLLLVVSVVQASVVRFLQEQAIAKSQSAQEIASKGVIEEMRKAFAKQRVDNLLAVDSASRKITLRDGIFARGSACITPAVAQALRQVQPQIADYLTRVPKGQILIEGHTDNKPVTKAVTDEAGNCAVYDDNFTLSAARAREARKLLVGPIDVAMARRLVVAGYGESHPLEVLEPGDGRNRRIEIRFTLVKD